VGGGGGGGGGWGGESETERETRRRRAEGAGASIRRRRSGRGSGCQDNVQRVHERAVVVLATGVTASSRMLTVLPDTAVSCGHVSTLAYVSSSLVGLVGARSRGAAVSKFQPWLMVHQ